MRDKIMRIIEWQCDEPGGVSSAILCSWHEFHEHEQVPWRSLHSALLPVVHLSKRYLKTRMITHDQISIWIEGQKQVQI